MRHNPKNTVIQFFDAWMIEDYAAMYGLCTITWADNYSLEYFTQMFEAWELLDYNFIGEEIAQGNEISDFMMQIKTKHETLPHKIRLVHEDRPYHASSSRGIFIIKGRWGINPISLLGLFRVDIKAQNKSVKISQSVKKVNKKRKGSKKRPKIGS
jgi:hypothetical protein